MRYMLCLTIISTCEIYKFIFGNFIFIFKSTYEFEILRKYVVIFFNSIFGYYYIYLKWMVLIFGFKRFEWIYGNLISILYFPMNFFNRYKGMYFK